jgi:hypothetical protein
LVMVISFCYILLSFVKFGIFFFLTGSRAP